jgi:1-acyl-sn-glycerol-3-phosphate acyltransferase
VLPFKSSLLEPAMGQPHSLSAGYIEYALNDGSVADEVCYWRDMTLVPHLLNLLGKRSVQARLRFTELRQVSPDRKQLARQLHSEVVRLKESIAV